MIGNNFAMFIRRIFFLVMSWIMTLGIWPGSIEAKDKNDARTDAKYEDELIDFSSIRKVLKTDMLSKKVQLHKKSIGKKKEKKKK